MRRRAAIIGGCISLACAAAPAHADDKEEVLRGMAQCADFADSLARLNCFDASTPQLKAVLGIKPPGTDPKMIPVPPSPMPQAMAPGDRPASVQSETASAAMPERAKAERESWFGLHLFGGRKSPQTSSDQFGNENLPAEQKPASAPVPQEIDAIGAKLSDYSINPTGRFVVFLDNGQIWRQVDTDKAQFKRDPLDNSVVIERGALGSYSMRLNGKNRVFKVTRIK